MPELRCGVNDCTHNKNDCCCCNEITVGGGTNAVSSVETLCKNFQEQSSSMTNDVRDENPNLFVNCTAEECQHNQGQRCTAQAVYISDNSISANSKDDTECVTFESR